MLEFETFSSAADFWRTYSDSKGNQMGYQHILDALKAKRELAVRDVFGSDAAAAKRYFDGNLAHEDARGAFVYRKGGQKKVYKKDRDIAIRWRKLLEDNDEIRARWEDMRDESISD